MTNLPGPGARSYSGWSTVYENFRFRMLERATWFMLAPVNIRGGAAVLVVDALKRALLLEIYRRSVDEVCLEIPRGMANEGESGLDCALRELREETGIEAHPDQVIDLGEVYPDNGILSARCSLFGVQLDTEFPEILLDTNEALGYQILPMNQFLAKIASGRISDAMTIAAASRFQSQAMMIENGFGGVEKEIEILDPAGEVHLTMKTRRPDWSFEQYTRDHCLEGWSWRFPEKSPNAD